jgi:hypothetical protein
MRIPRKVIHLTESQLIDSLEKRMKRGLKRIAELKLDWDANECIYQVLSEKRPVSMAIDARFYATAANPAASGQAPVSAAVAAAMMNFHSKLMMSEPMVVAKSLENDTLSKKAEEFTQQYCDNTYRSSHIVPILDEAVYADVAKKGIGILKIAWDKFAGDIKEAPADPDGEIIMTGDHEFKHQRPELFIIDPNARIFEVDARWCIAGEPVAVEELTWQLPEFADTILDMATADKKQGFNYDLGDSESEEMHGKLTSVILWTYYEKQLPENGMRGAEVTFFYGIGDESVLIIDRQALDNEHGQLPFSVLTDLPVDDAYGLARATLVAKHHDKLSRFYDKVEENIELFGETRLLMPSGLKANMKDPSGIKIIPFNGTTGEKPIYLQPSAVTGDIWRFRAALKEEIDQVFASGEFDRGEINRELSSYAVLTAIERSEAKLVGIFSKKKRFVKRMYMLMLSDAKQYITEERSFSTAGNMSHHTFTSFKGADLKGKVNLTVDYGMYQPIDPAARKTQLFRLLEIGALEKAGLPLKDTVSQLMGGDIQPIKDIADMAKDVQKEELWLLSTGEEAPVQVYHEHLTHLAVCAKFMNEPIFENFDLPVKQKIYDHYLAHKKLASEIMAKANPPPPPGAPGAAPAGPGGAPNAQGAPTQPPTPELPPTGSVEPV